MVIYDGLEARLVMDVHDAFSASSPSHSIRHALESIVEFEVLLHTDMMYPLVISRKVQ
jgi:hypothetical protein